MSMFLSTSLIVINAVYMKGLWQSPFKKSMTKKSKFSSADGQEREVDMMSQKGKFVLTNVKEMGAMGLEMKYQVCA